MTDEHFDELAGCKKIAVIAGHYCVSPDLDDLSSNGVAEELSFSKGIEAKCRIDKQGQPAALCLWVNDIGIPLEQRALMKGNYRIPENYARLIKNAGMVDSDVLVLFESSARNKASTLLKKMAKNQPALFRRHDSADSGLMRCVEGAICEIGADRSAYVIDGPEGENLVVKEGPNPKCNLILATLFLTLRQQHRCDGVVNIFNDIYVNRIRLGLHVYHSLFAKDNPMRFDNYFCGENAVRREVFSSSPLTFCPQLA